MMYCNLCTYNNKYMQKIKIKSMLDVFRCSYTRRLFKQKKKEKTPSSTSCFHVDQENVGSLLL